MLEKIKIQKPSSKSRTGYFLNSSPATGWAVQDFVWMLAVGEGEGTFFWDNNSSYLAMMVAKFSDHTFRGMF